MKYLAVSLLILLGAAEISGGWCGAVTCTPSCDESIAVGNCPVCQCSCGELSCLPNYFCLTVFDWDIRENSFKCCKSLDKLACVEPGDKDPRNFRAYI